MKVIDLLNKIANGEIDYEQQIKIDNEIINVSVLLGAYVFSKERLNDEVEIIEEDKPFNKRVEEIYNRHIDYIYDKEDKKIEKIKILNCDDYVKKGNYETILTMQEITLDIQTLKNKINKIIDYLEEKE